MSSKKRAGVSGTQGKNRISFPAINPAYLADDFSKEFSEVYTKKQDYTNESTGARIVSKPFQACCFPNFIDSKKFVRELKSELEEQIFYDKNNDLYKFQQTSDFRKLSTGYGKCLRKLFKLEVKSWLSNITGIQLVDKVDMTGSKYEYTDTLLCHDDELEGRRIAFILYLVPYWKKEDGGALDLFDTDVNNQPQNIVESLLPSENQLSFFEVSPVSFHQVGEILSKDKTRLSINGWFYGAPFPRPAPYIEPLQIRSQQTQILEDDFRSWINPIYLQSKVQIEIKEKFEVESEIELKGFLQDEKYMLLEEAIKSEHIKWTRKGPANKRNYLVGNLDESSEIIKEFVNLLKSEAFFLTVSNFTGLKLHHLAEFDSSSEEEDMDDDHVEEAAGDVKKNICEAFGLSEGALDSPVKTNETKRPRNTSGSQQPKKIQKTENEDEQEQSTENHATCSVEFRKWEHGCFTLVHDDDKNNALFALDAIFYCSCRDWNTECGGYTSYIARDENEELLTVNPVNNSLALVYRDKDTLKFVKHLNNKINDRSDPKFFEFNAVYYE